MKGFTVGEAMRTNIRYLTPHEWLSGAIDSTMSLAQSDFPIVENGNVVGLLTREALLRGIRDFGAYVPIAQVMRRDIKTIEADQALADASETMRANQLMVLPVTNHGTLVGMLTFDSIREFLMLHQMLKAKQTPAG